MMVFVYPTIDGLDVKATVKNHVKEIVNHQKTRQRQQDVP